ncbi:MAG: SDR family NAD(P)-dependent oxidoreductase, partial [Novosphingobium sp.]
MGILDKFRLDGQVAVVTGAGKGIGRAIAIGLAEAGADVAVASRTQADLDAVADEIRALGRRAERLNIQIAGRSAAHTIGVEVSGNDLGLSARADGRFDAQGWTQQWSTLALRLPDNIVLGLEQSLGVQLTTDSITVSPFC